MRRALVAAVLLALLALVPAAARTSTAPTPAARVGAFYFDGWAGHLSDFHFAGLLQGEFSGRRPLSGWRDNTPAALQAQLRWAHEDGISFFVFDWYSDADRSSVVLNTAHDNYLKLRDHDGVQYALMYVNQDPFVISPAHWPAVVEQWVTKDFQNPDYVRIDGKPLLVIIDEAFFTKQMGGASGVNAAIDTLQQVARKHGLPGVYVVGGRYVGWTDLYYNCFPYTCRPDTDPAFVQEHYDAITQYGYSLVVEPQDGPRPYADFTAAEEQFWAEVAARSPFRYMPSIMVGWDPRPIAQGLGPDPTSGYPWLFGHLFWTRGSPAEIASFLRDGIDWANANPDRRVLSQDGLPIVLVEAWNEFSEGAWVLPTDMDGYSYGQAIAQAVGIPWTPPPKHTLSVASSLRGTVTSTPSGISCPPTCAAEFDEGLQVTLAARANRASNFDGWGGCIDTDPTCSVVLVRDSTVRPVFLATVQRRALSLRLAGHLVARGRLSVRDGFRGCASYEQVQIQRRRGRGWLNVTSAQTDNGGRYTVTLRDRAGSYRARAAQDSVEDHICLVTTSRTVNYGR
jgi:hypothetical protein